MAVKFVKSCQQGSLYNPGEIAGFDKDVEARLIKQGFAEAVKAEPVKAEPAKQADAGK